MCSKRKVWVAILLITAFCISPLASPLAAQIAGFPSNTSEATSGLFTTDVDQFLDVNDWQDLEFDKFFTTIQLRGADGIGAGLAKKAGSVYLGFGYFGKLWSGGINSETTEYGDKYATAAWRGKKRVNNNYQADPGLAWTSHLSFLLGTEAAGGILLDLGFAGAGKDNDDVDSVPDGSGNITTAKNSIGLGTMEASLGWGKNFDLGGGYKLKPSLGFSYNLDLRKTVTSPGTSGSTRTTTLTGLDTFFSGTPYSAVNGGRVGLAGYVTGYAGLTADLSTSTGDGSLWVSYNLKYNIYDKQIKTKSGSWTDYDPSFVSHLINLGLGAWYRMDRKLSLGWSLESGFEIISAGVTSAYTDTMEGLGQSPDHVYTDAIFSIPLKAAAGVVFRPIPDKFNFNASIALFPIGDGFSYRKFDHTDISGVATASTNKNSRVNSMYSVTSLGFTWFITNGFSFDAAVATLAGGSRVNLTQFSALLSYKM